VGLSPREGASGALVAPTGELEPNTSLGVGLGGPIGSGCKEEPFCNWPIGELMGLMVVGGGAGVPWGSRLRLCAPSLTSLGHGVGSTMLRAGSDSPCRVGVTGGSVGCTGFVFPRSAR